MPVTSGRTYRLRFRVQNDKGWSGYSEQTNILAAGVPGKPLAAPHLIEVDSTNMKIGITPCSDSNGAAISNYRLEMKETSAGTYAEVKDFTVTETLEITLT